MSYFLSSNLNPRNLHTEKTLYSLQANGVLANRFPALLLARLTGFEALREPELAVLSSPFTGSHHAHDHEGQQCQASQHHVHCVELGGWRVFILS